MTTRAPRTGRVAEFDEGAGLGVVESGRGRFPFHCTQITDGSRTIEVGAAVTFEVVPARNGTWEAAAIVRRAAGQPPAAS